MALGFCLIFIGEAVAFNALQILAYTAIIFSVIHLFVVFIEEPGLKRRFGAPYEAYCQSVPPAPLCAQAVETKSPPPGPLDGPKGV